jgi:integrase
MSIHRRGEVWWYAFSVRGKLYRGSCKTKDEHAAQELHDRLKHEAWSERVLKKAVRRTWEDAADKWLADHAGKRSYKDDERYDAFWRREFAEVGVKYLDEVTPDVVADIRDEEVGRPKLRGDGVIQPATVNRHLAFLRSVMLAAAREWLWIPSSPKFVLLDEADWRMRFLTPPEFERLANALPEPYRAASRFAVTTGLRRANVFGLTWRNLSVQGGLTVATFAQQVMKNGLPFAIPLSPTAQAVIKAQMGKHPELVFPRPDGGRVCDIPPGMWKKTLAEAKLSDLRWHDLRHTWASWLRQSGVSLDRLQELGGWKSQEMVQRYAHLNVSHLAQHAFVIEQMLTSQAHSPNLGMGLARPFLEAVA